MSKDLGSASRFVLSIQEQRTTIGAGSRRRDLFQWECVWNVPEEYWEQTTHRQIIGTSRTSRADAVRRTEEQIDALIARA